MTNLREEVRKLLNKRDDDGDTIEEFAELCIRRGLELAAEIADQRADELRTMNGKPESITNSLGVAMRIRTLMKEGKDE
jgi:hypothetical protein